MKVIVAGAGLSGLVCKLLIPSSFVISEEIGNRHFAGRDSIKLHANDYNHYLLEQLGMEVPIKELSVGYEYGGVISPHPSEEFLQKWIPLKFGNLLEHMDKKKIKMSYAPKEKLFDINCLELFSVMCEKVATQQPSVVEGRIEKIEPNKVFFGSSSSDFDVLISTIPASIFWKAWGEPRTFQSVPVFFEKSFTPPKVWDGSFELVNYSSERYNRVQKMVGGYLFEGLGEMGADGKYESSTLHFGRFISEQNVPPENVHFVGRFAKWNSSIMIEDVVKDVLEIKEKYSI